MSGHTQNVKLKLENGYVIAEPSVLPNRKIGDKLRIQSDKKFTVVFKDRWPFSGKEHPISDRRARVFRTAGPFTFDCQISGPGGNPSTGYRRGYKGARGNVTP